MGRTVNKEKVRGAWILKREGNTQEAIAENLEIGRRTVQNYHSQKWLAKQRLSYLQYFGRPESSRGSLLDERQTV